MRRHPRRAEVDPTAPRAWGTSDRNGMIGQHNRMQWQYDWAGFELINQRILVHEDELDVPQRQLGSIIIPPDPLPIPNARPEQYAMDEEPVSTITTEDGKYLIVTYPDSQLYSLLVANVPGDPA